MAGWVARYCPGDGRETEKELVLADYDQRRRPGGQLLSWISLLSTYQHPPYIYITIINLSL